MSYRPAAFLITFSLATALISEARANECWEGADYRAENAIITLTPPLPCVKLRVEGRTAGCDDLALLYENHCAEPIFTPSREIPPGTTGSSRVLVLREGPHTFKTSITHEGETIAVVVTVDIVDVSGCSVGAPGGRAPAGWPWALGLAAVAWAARRSSASTRPRSSCG